MRSLEYVLWVVGTCVAYATTAKLGLEYAIVGHTVTLIWPPSGIALAAIVIGGYRMWPGIALGALLANFGTGAPLVSVLIITLGNTLEPLCGTALLRLGSNFSHGLNRVSGVLALFLFGSVISTAVSASLGTLGLLAGQVIRVGDIGPTWLAWWLGDGLGVLVIAPILLTARQALHSIRASFSYLKLMEAAVIGGVLMEVGGEIFGSPIFSGFGYFPVALSLFPFAIWSALRFDPFGTSMVTLLASSLAIWGTVQGTGPFASDSATESLIYWCLFADIMAVTGLLLGAVRIERETALAALMAANDDLERRVDVRTEELTRANSELQAALVERRGLQLEMSQISEARQKMIGQELHDSIGQQLTGMALLARSLEQTLAAQAAPGVPSVRQFGSLLDEAIAKVRSLSRGLYPIVLENEGLAAALHHLAGHARSYSDAHCTAQCADGECVMDRATELNLYRIAQEAVSNALRHSNAKTIDIKLSASADRYLLLVEDDGLGIDWGSQKIVGTLGMRSMRSRAELIGATIEIGAGRSSGTAVRVFGPASSRGGAPLAEHPK